MKYTIILLTIIAMISAGMLYQETKKCDTWNIALAREQEDGSINTQFVRICKNDFEALNSIMK